MFHEPLFSDVTVILIEKTGGTSVSLDLHRNVLAHSCAYFCGMFTRQFKESKAMSVTVEAAQGSTVAAMCLVIEFLYTGKIDLTGDNAA